MFISNNRPSFHLRRKKNLIKHQKVSKYSENDCRSSNTTNGTVGAMQNSNRSSSYTILVPIIGRSMSGNSFDSLTVYKPKQAPRR